MLNLHVRRTYDCGFCDLRSIFVRYVMSMSDRVVNSVYKPLKLLRPSAVQVIECRFEFMMEVLCNCERLTSIEMLQQMSLERIPKIPKFVMRKYFGCVSAHITILIGRKSQDRRCPI